MPISIYTLSFSTRFNSSFFSSSVKPNLTISSSKCSFDTFPDNTSGIRNNSEMYFRPSSIVYTFLNFPHFLHTYSVTSWFLYPYLLDSTSIHVSFLSHSCLQAHFSTNFTNAFHITLPILPYSLPTTSQYHAISFATLSR